MLRWLALATGIVMLDQVTKYIVEHSFVLHEMREVTSFFNLVLVYNRGAAFSMLADAGGWQRELFIGIAVVASTWMVWLLRKHARETLFCLGLALILGGAIGNVIDRLLVGAVVDFLDFHAFGYHWPAFNVADMAISGGAGALIWDALRPKRAHAV